MEASRPAFSGSRLRLARAFNGWTQAELGERVDVSHQYIGYLETGHKVPSEGFLEALADDCGFESAFFTGEPIEEFRDEECHFRRRATTPVSVRSRVLAHGSLFGMVVHYLDSVLSLPPDDVPCLRVHDREGIEQAAERCRERWGLGKDLPIKNLTRAVERAGVIVTRFPGSAAKIDAFSRASKRSVIVLNTDKGSPSRARFDLAHECGHLVMHGGLTTGDSRTEREADSFASALLLPRAGFVPEFPRSPRMDWEALLRLKKRWGASCAALVRRAHDLGLIDLARYQRAYKYMAWQGWLKGEPQELEPELPELVPLSLQKLGEHLGASPLDLCQRLHWQPATFEKVVGTAVPAPPRQARGRPGKVVQLALIRAERSSSRASEPD